MVFTICEFAVKYAFSAATNGALSALWLERGNIPAPGKRTCLAVLAAGLTAAAINAAPTRRITASRGSFADAFGADWQEQIPTHLKGGASMR